MQADQIKNTLSKGLKRDYEITLPWQEVDAKIELKAQKIQPDYKIDGFRKGTVPVTMIRGKYEQNFMSEILNESAQEGVKHIVDNDNLRLASQPQVDIDTFETQKDLKFKISIETLPDLSKLDFKKLSIEKDEVEIADKDIEEYITDFSKNLKDWEEKDQAYQAKKGDQVELDIKPTSEGSKYQEINGAKIEVGGGQFLPGFDDHLENVKAGEVKNIELPDPQAKEGEKASFELKIIKVYIPKTVELSDKYIKDNLGLENMEALKETARKRLDDAYARLTYQNIRLDLMDAFVKKFKFELPEKMLEAEYQRALQNMGIATKKAEDLEKKERKELESQQKKAKEIADKMVRTSIILEQVGHENKVEAMSDDALVKELQSGREDLAQLANEINMNQQLEPRQMIDILKRSVWEQEVIDVILKDCSIKTKKLSSKDFKAKQEKRIKNA